jgi:hypothetical protein
MLRRFAPRLFAVIGALSLVVFSIWEASTIAHPIDFRTTSLFSYGVSTVALFVLLPIGLFTSVALLVGLGRGFRDGLVDWFMDRSEQPVGQKKWVIWALPRKNRREIEQKSELREEEKVEEEDVIRERRKEEFD